MKVKTRIKGGRMALGGANHNSTLVRGAVQLKVKTRVKSGGRQMSHNHSQTRAA
jgi:hypothetical protein